MKPCKLKSETKEIEKVRIRFSLTLLFTFLIFFVLVISAILCIIIIHLLIQNGFIIRISSATHAEINRLILFFAIISIIVGTILSYFAGKIPLRPINLLVTQMNRLASGDFKARLHFGKIIKFHNGFSEAEKSFNKLAEELENTEMLRADFINNFSHEFKTPIVSIAGFAKLLKHGNLSDAQKNEYISVIEEESIRLASMATNVLNLTKVENQTILTDICRFNLSEQIRSAVLLLENKWSEKKIELKLDFPEYIIEANEELLKQVWINLTDNAVKFSPDYGPLEISIIQENSFYKISFTNCGNIPKKYLERIWNKFYQLDESHSSEGNGVGLAIVKRVAELHRGYAEVSSKNGAVTFSVILPEKQN